MDSFCLLSLFSGVVLDGAVGCLVWRTRGISSRLRSVCFSRQEVGAPTTVPFPTEGKLPSWCSQVGEEVVPASAWLGRGFSCVCAPSREYSARLLFDLTPSQEECLQRLHNRIEVMYDATKLEHQEALKALWNAAFPGVEFHGLISEKWKEMGWQGKDPSTDFRGGGFVSLENLLFFARHFPKSFQELLRKQGGDRALWEYPFAIAGVNITFMLIQMLGLLSVKPRTLAGGVFLKLLSENEAAFDILYCMSFKLLDCQWLAMHASYMDFNVVLKSTKRQLERELLSDDIQRIEDMPSYDLLQHR